MRIGPSTRTAKTRMDRIGKRLCQAVATLSMIVSVSAVSAQSLQSAQTQTGARAQITAAINPAQRAVLSNSVHPLANAANDRGRADSSTPMKDMILLLHPTQAQSAALKQLVSDMHNPNSASFHKWLTPAQYAAQYGLDDADIQTVSSWLASSGFTIEQVAKGKNWIRFSGTAAQVEDAFQTTIHQYSVNGEKHLGNSTNLSIPAALTPAVTGVVRIHNFLSQAEHVAPGKITRDKSGKMVRTNATGTNRATTGNNPKPAITINGDQTETYLTPADFAKIYDSQSSIAAGVDGTGTSIAIVGRSDIELSDVEAFRTIFNLPQNDPTILYATTDPGDISGDDAEGTLDVEWSGAVAPKAKINFVIGASTGATDGVDVAATYIVDNALSPIMSVSFGLCEAFMSDTQIAFYNQLWQQAASEGISVFVSTGDSGASSCNNPGAPSTVYGFGVSGLASTPYNTAVGGTEFNESTLSNYWNLTNNADQSSVKGYIPEAVWNESCTEGVAYGFTNCNFAPYEVDSYAGSGGASSCVTRTNDGQGDEFCASGYAKPSWQSAPGMPADGVRDIPDVSLAAAAAHDAYSFCFEGGCQWITNRDGSLTVQNANIIGGTSAASPSMAGVMALVETKHGLFQGLANYQFYNLAAQSKNSCDSSKRTDPTQASSCVFNDITTGSNGVACFSGGQDCQGTNQPVQVGLQLPEAVFFPDSQMDGHAATAGYDLGSGLGSVDVANLIAAWGTLSTASSATTLKLSQTTFTHGTAITVSGTVAPTSGTGSPTGDVLLTTSSNTSVLSTSLTSGAYSTSSINLPGGTYTVTSKYSGDTNYGVSTSQPVSVTVTPEGSSLTGTTFAPSRFYILGRQPIIQTSNTLLGNTFWVQVQVAGASGSTAATGSIKLSVAGKLVGTYPVSNTGLIYVACGPETACDLAPGTYSFEADYSGDSSFNASTTMVPFTVTKGHAFWSTTANILEPVANTPVIGYVVFNTDPGIPPTGTVTLSRDDTGAVLGTATIDKTGVATIPFTPMAGSFNLIATYGGDANYTAGGQSGTQQIITLVNSGTKKMSLTLSLGASSFSVGQRTQVTVTATSATSGSTASPIGFVLLYNDYGEVGGQLLLGGGKATGQVEWDIAGAQNVYAVYGGDGNYAPGSSSKIAITVNKGVPSLLVQPVASVIAVGGQASVTALLGNPNPASTTAPAPTGSIQFYDAINGAASVAIGTPQGVTGGNQGTLLATLAPLLATGSHVITAVYSGDTNWASATSAPTAPIVVTTPSFTDAATPNPLIITAGQTSALTISTQSVLGYSADIALSCGTALPEGLTCASATVMPGSTGTISINSVAPGEASANSSAASHNPLLATSGVVAMAGLFLICIPNRRRFHHLSVVLLALGLLGGVIGCSGSSMKTTSMVLTSANTKVASGGTVTLQANVQSTNNTTGTVTFYDGSTAIGSPAQVTGGVATLTTTGLAVGTHPITAKYSGDKDDSSSSSSNVIQQTVTGTFTLNINATSGTLSEPIAISATLQ
jgi:subtilase family serine protease